MIFKNVYVLGGGTVSPVKPHLQLCSWASGHTAKLIAEMYRIRPEAEDRNIVLKLTRMAGGDPSLHTISDVANYIDHLIVDENTKMIFMSIAMCNYIGVFGDDYRGGGYSIDLEEGEKIIRRIRKQRKDIYLIGFKQTHNMSADEQYIAGLSLLKAASCNLVLANDDTTKLNMIVVPEEARYCVTTDRMSALRELVKIAIARSALTYTRSDVIPANLIPWESVMIPATFKVIINHLIRCGAYKPFGKKQATAGHFAVKMNDGQFLTSVRGSNFNKINEPGQGMVMVGILRGGDRVEAWGAKPSVGGQSQRIVFNMHKEYDCIVHFHCERKWTSSVPIASQREYECGSHECGLNTANNMQKVGNLGVVYLDNHGPNICFHRSINPAEVIDFIEENFDLTKKTGGAVELV